VEQLISKSIYDEEDRNGPPCANLASYPGLLTPAFVACSTITRGKAW